MKRKKSKIGQEVAQRHRARLVVLLPLPPLKYQQVCTVSSSIIYMHAIINIFY